eukprot:scaffold1811_cov411-Prasinococcus_capsulatus_cf.AAC.23
MSMFEATLLHGGANAPQSGTRQRGPANKTFTEEPLSPSPGAVLDVNVFLSGPDRAHISLPEARGRRSTHARTGLQYVLTNYRVVASCLPYASGPGLVACKV